MLAVYQKDFLRAALAVAALKFGDFTLKSGRQSPYFFNAGAFASGEALTVMARAYAATVLRLREAGIHFDALYGPAYKGIPLVAAVAVILHAEHGLSLPWTFNRKEAKDHGEGGTLVGAPLAGKRVLILDDVLTAGTAIRESLAVLRAADAAPVAVVVALDRQETVDGGDTALARLAQTEQLTTAAVVTLDDLLQFIGDDTTLAIHLSAMQEYRARYGAGR